MKTYAVVFERGNVDEENWGAFVPDLPGCITTGDTLEEAQANIKQAIAGHIATLRQLGRPVPDPTTEVGRVAVAA